MCGTAVRTVGLCPDSFLRDGRGDHGAKSRYCRQSPGSRLGSSPVVSTNIPAVFVGYFAGSFDDSSLCACHRSGYISHQMRNGGPTDWTPPTLKQVPYQGRSEADAGLDAVSSSGHLLCIHSTLMRAVNRDLNSDYPTVPGRC